MRQTLSFIAWLVTVFGRVAFVLSYDVIDSLEDGRVLTDKEKPSAKAETNCDETTCTGCAIGIIIACLIVGLLIGFGVLVVLRLRRDSQTGSGVSSTEQKRQREVVIGEIEYDKYQQITPLVHLLSSRDEEQVLKSLELHKYNIDFFKVVDFLQKITCMESLKDFISKEVIKKVRDQMSIEEADNELFQNKMKKIEKEYEHLTSEISERKKTSKSFSKEFQDEVAPLFDRRLRLVNHDFELIHSLAKLKQELASSAENNRTVIEILKEQLAARRHEDQAHIELFHQFYLMSHESFLFVEKMLRDVERAANRRATRVVSYFATRHAEKQSWNRMIGNVNDLARNAKRRNFISKEAKRELVSWVVEQMTMARRRYVEEQKKSYRTLVKQTESKKLALQRTEFIWETEGDQSSLIKLLKKIKQVHEKSMQVEEDTDDFFMEKLEMTDANLSQEVMVQISYTRNKMKSSLLEKGVDEMWLEDELRNLALEEKSLRRECTASVRERSKEELQLILPPLRDNERSAQVEIGTIRQLQALQPSINHTQQWKCTMVEMIALRVYMFSFIRGSVDEQMDKMVELLSTKRERIAKVGHIEHPNEDELFDELDQKLQVVVETRIENNSPRINDASVLDSSLLASFLKEAYSSKLQIKSLKNEKRAIECIFIESLRVLLQSKKINTSQCNSLINELKYQVEEVTQYFKKMLREREFELRRKAEADVLKKKATNLKVDEDDWRNLILFGDKILDEEERELKEKRVAFQKLFYLRENIYTEKLKASLEKVLLLARSLFRDEAFRKDGVRRSLTLLLPEQSANYLNNITSVMCEKSDDETQESVVDNSRQLYEGIKAVVKENLRNSNDNEGFHQVEPDDKESERQEGYSHQHKRLRDHDDYSDKTYTSKPIRKRKKPTRSQTAKSLSTGYTILS